MSGIDTNVQETMKDVIGKAYNPPNKDNNPIVDTTEGVSTQTSEGETTTGETPVYHRGIDISDIPEQDRPRIMKYLDSKVSQVEKGANEKFAEISKFKKMNDNLAKLGLSTDEVEDVVRKHLESKRNPSQTVNQQTKQNLKILDQLIETAPYEQRETFKQLRQIVAEETGVESLRQELETMKKTLGMASQSAVGFKTKELNAELDSTFTEKLGKDFVDKYREQIVNTALQNPNVPLSKIIKHETPDDEYETALLSKGKRQLTDNKRNAISSSGSGIAGSVSNIDPKSYKSTADLIHAMRKLGRK